MTNEQIIWAERMNAMESGIIGTTGRLITVEIDGEKKQILEPEELHTFIGWKSLGYSIKKGEKTKVVTYLWKMKKLNKTEKAAVEAMDADPEDDDDHFIKVKANLFSSSQVHRPDKTPDDSSHKTDSVTPQTKNNTPDPAPTPEPGTAAVNELCITFENGSMTVSMNEFFPADHNRLNKLVKLMKEDRTHETDLMKAMISYLQNRIQELGGTETKGDYKTEKLKAAYTKNLVWLGAAPADEKAVKISGKTEMFEILTRAANKGDLIRKVKFGYRATYAGYTFFVMKNGSWDIYESRSGLHCGYASTKSGCAAFLEKYIDLQKMKSLNFDDLEARKLSAPLETIAA